VAAVAGLGGPEQLLTASYGRLVTAKLVLFGVIVALAAYARRVHVVRLRNADGIGAAVAMRKMIVLELALAMTALTAAGNLAATGPPA
jgi:copper transport protein